MDLNDAIKLIRPAVLPASGTWADIGAGTGMFTEALMSILTEGKIIALDKSPHGLYKIKSPPSIALEIVDGDFNDELQVPPVDGMIMANALHYAKDHLTVLKNVLSSLKPGGNFILIEYDTDQPNDPWVPNPVSLKQFKVLCQQMDLAEPKEIGRMRSIYSDGEIYAAMTART